MCQRLSSGSLSDDDLGNGSLVERHLGDGKAPRRREGLEIMGTAFPPLPQKSHIRRLRSPPSMSHVRSLLPPTSDETLRRHVRVAVAGGTVGLIF